MSLHWVLFDRVVHWVGFCFLGSQESATTGGSCASSFTSGSSVVLIIAFASLNWQASLQTVRPSVTRLAINWEPWLLHTA